MLDVADSVGRSDHGDVYLPSNGCLGVGSRTRYLCDDFPVTPVVVVANVVVCGWVVASAAFDV